MVNTEPVTQIHDMIQDIGQSPYILYFAANKGFEVRWCLRKLETEHLGTKYNGFNIFDILHIVSEVDLILHSFIDSMTFGA